MRPLPPWVVKELPLQPFDFARGPPTKDITWYSSPRKGHKSWAKDLATFDLGKLPPEIQIMILGMMTRKELAKLSKASRNMHKLAAKAAELRFHSEKFRPLTKLYWDGTTTNALTPRFLWTMSLRLDDARTLAILIARIEVLPPFAQLPRNKDEYRAIVTNIAFWLLQLDAFCEFKRDELRDFPKFKAIVVPSQLYQVHDEVDLLVFQKHFIPGAVGPIFYIKQLLVRTLLKLLGNLKNVNPFPVTPYEDDKRFRGYEGCLLFCGLQAIAHSIRETDRRTCTKYLNLYLARVFCGRECKNPTVYKGDYKPPLTSLANAQIAYEERFKIPLFGVVLTRWNCHMFGLPAENTKDEQKRIDEFKRELATHRGLNKDVVLSPVPK